MVIYFIGYTPYTVRIWDNDSLLVSVHCSYTCRQSSISCSPLAKQRGSWDHYGWSWAGDDFSSADCVPRADDDDRVDDWREDGPPLWASIDRYVSFVGSGHVINLHLSWQAFWLSDPILCLFVVGMMQTKISCVIRFILFYVGLDLALAGLKTYVSL